MVTYFNKKDLIAFGNYVLSQERAKRLQENPQEGEDPVPYEDRKTGVHHADVENWLNS